MSRRSRRQRPRSTRPWPILVAIGASLVLGLVAYRLLHQTPAPTPTVSFSELAQALAAHDVKELHVNGGGARLVATLVKPRT
ncbi:MAG TPA: hypothetical protein VGR59_04920, partial [Gemmatimonadaceae bacterium]|nr:hypothetical protein [Gemmatimonadaceae bacterium]